MPKVPSKPASKSRFKAFFIIESSSKATAFVISRSKYVPASTVFCTTAHTKSSARKGSPPENLRALHRRQLLTVKIQETFLDSVCLHFGEQSSEHSANCKPESAQRLFLRGQISVSMQTLLVFSFGFVFLLSRFCFRLVVTRIIKL